MLMEITHRVCGGEGVSPSKELCLAAAGTTRLASRFVLHDHDRIEGRFVPVGDELHPLAVVGLEAVLPSPLPGHNVLAELVIVVSIAPHSRVRRRLVANREWLAARVDPHRRAELDHDPVSRLVGVHRFAPAVPTGLPVERSKAGAREVGLSLDDPSSIHRFAAWVAFAVGLRRERSPNEVGTPAVEVGADGRRDHRHRLGRTLDRVVRQVGRDRRGTQEGHDEDHTDLRNLHVIHLVAFDGPPSLAYSPSVP